MHQTEGGVPDAGVEEVLDQGVSDPDHLGLAVPRLADESLVLKQKKHISHGVLVLVQVIVSRSGEASHHHDPPPVPVPVVPLLGCHGWNLLVRLCPGVGAAGQGWVSVDEG